MLGVAVFCIVSGVAILHFELPFAGFTAAFAGKYLVEIIFNLTLIFRFGRASI